MYVKAISWMGVKTSKYSELTYFFEEVLGLKAVLEEQDFVVFQLPNKDKVEVFGPHGPNQHFAQDSIVCGFLVEDIEQARQELVKAGIELIGPLCRADQSSYAWQHFRGPDGKIYELTYDPEHG